MMPTVYDDQYARRYRHHDDALGDSRPYRELVAWLQRAASRFAPGFDALDLGCGTGRYFWAIGPAGTLVGLDASPAMLAEAAAPLHSERVEAARVELVHGDVATHEFAPASFDLVYSVGVLAEHVPLDSRVVRRVARWLRPGGRFAFTTVHPESPSIPTTAKRGIARRIARLAPAWVERPLQARLLAGGLYADEQYVRELLDGAFTIESLERFESEAHLHLLVVARKVS